MWIYNSAIGVLKIVYLPETQRYGFQYGDMVYGSYRTPVAASDDVCTQHTGCEELDDRELDLPGSLSDWVFIPTKALPRPPEYR